MSGPPIITAPVVPPFGGNIYTISSPSSPYPPPRPPEPPAPRVPNYAITLQAPAPPSIGSTISIVFLYILVFITLGLVIYLLVR